MTSHRTRTSLKAAAAAVLAALALTACGGDEPVPGDPDYVAKSAAPAVSQTPAAEPTEPAPAPTDSVSDPGPADDPVFGIEKLVAELGVANSGLLDPALDSRDEMLAPARVVLTPEALTRYEKTLPPEGKPERTSLEDSAAWQLVAHTSYAEGDETRTLSEPLVGPLKVTETSRTELPSGGFEVAFTATQTIASERVPSGEQIVSTLTREYVLVLVPSTSTTGPAFLVDDWTGTKTTSSEFTPASGS